MIQVSRGTQDILPGRVEKWQFVEKIVREICTLYNYNEIRTPIFENTELFNRGVGASTDIVQKEMYTFSDRSERSITLKPEGTAPVVRSFIENKLYSSPMQPTKLYYISPVFRYERPGSGRYRQHHQFGVEAIGASDPALDVEVISLVVNFLKRLGLINFQVVINSLGDSLSRKHYRERLISYFEPHITELCSDCQRRISTNPLRILDCKADSSNPIMKSAPIVLEYLSGFSEQYFTDVRNHLENLEIDYVVDSRLVRGLDYYSHTVFEVILNEGDFGTKISLCGGGRYDSLVEQLDGPKISGIGFGVGIERLLLALDRCNVSVPCQDELDCYVVSFGERAQMQIVPLLYKLRQAGISTECDYCKKKSKAQFKAADRHQAYHVIIIGDDELDKGVLAVKNMKTGEQVQVEHEHIINFLMDEKRNRLR